MHGSSRICRTPQANRCSSAMHQGSETSLLGFWKLCRIIDLVYSHTQMPEEELTLGLNKPMSAERTIQRLVSDYASWGVQHYRCSDEFTGLLGKHPQFLKDLLAKVKPGNF